MICSSVNRDRFIRPSPGWDGLYTNLEEDLGLRSERIGSQSDKTSSLTRERIQAFADLMCDKLDNGDVQTRKAYLRSVITRIEVDKEKARIIREKARLADIIAGKQAQAKNVRGFVRKWRTRHDSNVRPLPSEGSALSS